MSGSMTSDRSAHEKRRQLQVMLDAGLVMLHLDPRGEDVAVPPQFKGDPVLRLNLAWGFNLPALDVGPDGVYAVLSFNRANFGCTLPWRAVFAMTAPDAGHEGVVWPESVPPELAPYFEAAGASTGGVPVSLRAEPRARGEKRPGQAAPRPAPHPAAAAASEDDATPPPLPDAAGPASAPRPLFIVHEGGRDEAAPPSEGSAKRANLRVVK
ncbi:MAG: hypothetical protein U1F43_38225 [Myxococcota bacterium]